MATSAVNTQIAQAITKLENAQTKTNGNAASLIGKAIGDLLAAQAAALLNPSQG